MKFKVGTKIQWKWLGRFIQGSVQEVHIEPIQKTIKGKKIKRNGTVENPAYLVLSEAGNLALKLQSELTIQPSTQTSPKPRMFSNE